MAFKKLLCSALIAASIIIPGAGVADSGALGRDNVTYIIGTSAGGGYDRYGRLVAKYMAKHLPDVTVTPENRPKFSGIPALRDVRDKGQDGGEVMLFNTGLILSQIGGMENMDVQLETYRWLGKASSEARVLMMQSNSGITSFQQLLENSKDLVFITSNFGNSAFVQTHLLKDAFGLEMKVLAGFNGSEAKAAIIKGEADGYLTSESNVSKLMANGAAVPILVFGDSDLPALQGLPRGLDVAKTDDQKIVAKAITALTQLGRPTIGSPDMDDATLAILRAAYGAAVQDPEFLAEAKAQRMPIDYMPGDKVEDLVKQLLVDNDRLSELVAATLTN